MKKFLFFIILNLVFLLYSISGIFTKSASQYEFFSFEFIVFYGLTIIIMIIYAFFWQKILKKVPLNVAYSNKAVVIVWGLIWGHFLFNESINFIQIVGAVIIIVGIVTVISGGVDKQHE